MPLVGVILALLLSSLLHAYAAFELVWLHQGIGLAQRFALIERHWLYFAGYGSLLAILSIQLRFWDLCAVRAVLAPLYVANAPHARFESRRVEQPLPLFQLPLMLFNSLVQSAARRQGIPEAGS